MTRPHRTSPQTLIRLPCARQPVATPQVRRKRGRPRDPEADGRILAAASSLILLRGFDSMTVDEVATNAGVGKATVYRRWARKEDLAVAAMEQLYRDEMPVARHRIHPRRPAGDVHLGADAS